MLLQHSLRQCLGSLVRDRKCLFWCKIKTQIHRTKTPVVVAPWLSFWVNGAGPYSGSDFWSICDSTVQAVMFQHLSNSLHRLKNYFLFGAASFLSRSSYLMVIPRVLLPAPLSTELNRLRSSSCRFIQTPRSSSVLLHKQLVGEWLIGAYRQTGTFYRLC